MSTQRSDVFLLKIIFRFRKKGGMEKEKEKEKESLSFQHYHNNFG